MADLIPIWASPHIFQTDQGLQRHGVSWFSVALRHGREILAKKKKKRYSKTPLYFPFWNEEAWARGCSPSQNIRDPVAVAQRKKQAPHTDSLICTFHIPGNSLITDHLIYLGAVPGSLSNFIPIRAMMWTFIYHLHVRQDS